MSRRGLTLRLYRLTCRRGAVGKRITPTFGIEPPVVGVIRFLYNLNKLRMFLRLIVGRVNRHSRNSFGEGATSASVTSRLR